MKRSSPLMGFRWLALCASLAACGSDQRRPEGPPPEYEPRRMAPWPPVASPESASAPSEPLPLPSVTAAWNDAGVAPAGLCCDAGVR